MSKVIDLLCNDGSPIGIVPDDIEGRGVGGAELAMMTLMEVLAERGHQVRVFNDPVRPGNYNGVDYLPLAVYEDRIPRDVIIVFRSPNRRFHRGQMPPETRKIWWSTDQYTIGSFAELANEVDFCVTISPYHTDFHLSNYNIDKKKIGHIDLGVRTWEYDDAVEKIPGQMLFCSIPDRGLPVLHSAYPLIKRDAPHASLVITSDYTLWGSPQGAGNERHRLQWAEFANQGVTFRGKVPRSELMTLQRQSEIMAYPSTYDELFCISAAECQVSGALPITTEKGALVTTNEFGIIVPGIPTMETWLANFSSRIVALLTSENDYLKQRQTAMMRSAKARFDWQKIAERWEELFEEGTL